MEKRGLTTSATKFPLFPSPAQRVRFLVAVGGAAAMLMVATEGAELWVTGSLPPWAAQLLTIAFVTAGAVWMAHVVLRRQDAMTQLPADPRADHRQHRRRP